MRTGTSQSGKSTLLERLSSPTGEARVHTPVYAADASQKPVLDLGLSYSFLDMGDGEGPSRRPMVPRLTVRRNDSAVGHLPIAVSGGPVSLSPPSRAIPYDATGLAGRDCARLESTLVIRARAAGLDRDSRAGIEHRWRRVGGSGGARTTCVLPTRGSKTDARTVEAHLRHYFEPSNAPASAAPTSSAAQLVDLESPLPEGVLSTNLGLGIVIVCTKVGSPLNEIDPG